MAIVVATVTEPGSVAIPDTSLEKPLSLFELSYAFTASRYVWPAVRPVMV